MHGDEKKFSIHFIEIDCASMIIEKLQSIDYTFKFYVYGMRVYN